MYLTFQQVKQIMDGPSKRAYNERKGFMRFVMKSTCVTHVFTELLLSVLMQMVPLTLWWGVKEHRGRRTDGHYLDVLLLEYSMVC